MQVTSESNPKANPPESNSTAGNSGNPLLERGRLPAFDRIEPAHVVPAVRHTLATATRALEEVEAPGGPRGWALVEALQALEYDVSRTWGPVGHLLGVRNSPELREAYETVEPEVITFTLRLAQSRPVFDALSNLTRSDEWRNLTPAGRRAVELRLRDARHSGVGLDGAARERFNEIASELSSLSTGFSNHVLDATKAFFLDLNDPAQLEGLPPSYRAMAAQSYTQATGQAATPEDGPWRVTLDLPGYLPFMQHGRVRALREQLYRAQITRASEVSGPELDNTPLIQRILSLRAEQARLLDFSTWADFSLSSKMAGSVAEVEELMEQLRVAAYQPAARELADLRDFARGHGFTEELRPWDVPFWAERLREERFQYTDEELRAYFPLPRVLEGLFALAGRIFGVHIRAADGTAAVWHPDVRFFEITDEAGTALAAFYLDPYSRPENKRGGAWMGDCLGRRKRVDGSLELPVAYLICNGTPPVGTRPSLLSFSDVETLFHEFGHGLQHMLTQVEVPDVAGINGVEWDAVELPSQFMENWCYHRPTLAGMSAHVDTGEPLPEALYQKLLSARTYRAASDMLRQLRFSLVDLELHHRFDPAGRETVFDVQRRIESKTSHMAGLPEDRFLCSFSHIFAGGYSAGYYSYKWAEVLSADAFGAFEEAGLDDEAAMERVGRRFRDTVLALGGSEHPMRVFEAFRGRKPDIAALLRHSGLAA